MNLANELAARDAEIAELQRSLNEMHNEVHRLQSLESNLRTMFVARVAELNQQIRDALVENSRLRSRLDAHPRTYTGDAAAADWLA